MNEQTNVDIVKQIYAAYGKGDIPGILSLMAEEVVHHEPPAGAAPYRGTYEGHDGVRAFFQAAFETITVEQFEVREFVAKANTVIELGRYCFRGRATLLSYETDGVMAWRLKDGKVVGWTTYKDSAVEAAALGD